MKRTVEIRVTFDDTDPQYDRVEVRAFDEDGQHYSAESRSQKSMRDYQPTWLRQWKGAAATTTLQSMARTIPWGSVL